MTESVSGMMTIDIAGGTGPASSLIPMRVPKPVPSEGEILIRVRAAGINRPDINQRNGSYPPPPGASSVLGLEVAGEIVCAAGRWRVGDRVCALVNGGGYAEYVACDARHALPVPAGYDWARAAALPENVFTVFANVFEHGVLQPGESFLFHGANSGIGVTAIQMAKAHGARVIVTARGRDKAERARDFGADICIDADSEDFLRIIQKDGGVDVVLQMVGGHYFAKDLEALKTGGRIVFIAAQANAHIEMPVLTLMQKRGTITGSTLRPRSADEKARIASEVERVVWPWLEAGRMRPVIDRVFPLASAADAHAYLESHAHFGKVLLSIDPTGPELAS